MKKSVFVLLACFISISCFGQLKISLNNIDDTGFAAVINPKALERLNEPSKMPVHFRVDWDNANGNGSQDLYNKIPSDGGILVVGLWNKVFDGFFGGKYSYSISAYLNNSKIFGNSENVRDNSEGMKYFKAYIVTKDGEYVDLEVENYDLYDGLWNMYSARFSGEGGMKINWAPMIEELGKH